MNPTIYDLYTKEDKLPFIDPMRSGRSHEVNETTARNVAQLIYLFVPDADNDSLNEIQRVVRTNRDIEANMDALLEELMSNPSYNVANIAEQAKKSWNQFLSIGF